jgi:hypothetical protein
MAIQRHRPYVQCNFHLDLGADDTKGPIARFQKCSIIGTKVTAAEYRAGNHKITSINEATR